MNMDGLRLCGQVNMRLTLRSSVRQWRQSGKECMDLRLECASQ